MRYLTDADYQQLKDYGYDIASLTEAKEALARSKRADELVAHIKREFSGISLGNGMSLRQGRALDNHESDEVVETVRQYDELEDWQKIPPEDLAFFNSCFSFYDEEACRFHLPAFLTADLQGFPDTSITFIILARWEYISKLPPSQISIVRDYLHIIKDDPDEQFSRDDIIKTIASYDTHLQQLSSLSEGEIKH